MDQTMYFDAVNMVVSTNIRKVCQEYMGECIQCTLLCTVGIRRQVSVQCTLHMHHLCGHKYPTPVVAGYITHSYQAGTSDIGLYRDILYYHNTKVISYMNIADDIW